MPPGPGALQCIKGYLLLATDLGVAVFNTTMASRSGPREVVLEPLATIGASFGREVSGASIEASLDAAFLRRCSVARCRSPTRARSL